MYSAAHCTPIFSILRPLSSLSRLFPGRNAKYPRRIYFMNARRANETSVLEDVLESHTHTHTYAQRKREREGGREKT